MRRRLKGLLSRLRRALDSDGAVGEAREPMDRFISDLESAVSRNDRSVALEMLKDYRQFVEQVEAAVSPATERRLRNRRPLALGPGVQSKQFMIDLLPSIQSFLNRHPRDSVFDVLDVGAGAGHGSNLLASLYATSELGYRLRVTALDINDVYELYIAAACRYVRFVKEDVFHIDRTFDVVLASHVIEHVAEPIAFCRQLQRVATGMVVIATPFKEPVEGRTKGHLHSFDESFVEELAPASFQVINSEAWGRFMAPPYEMLIAELDPLPERL